jgi:hypothetical protein
MSHPFVDTNRVLMCHMIKQISVMKRNPKLTMEQFVSEYEERHAKFGEQLFSKARRYVRRYVQPEKSPLTGVSAELDFDVIMEIWWESRADYEAAMKALPNSGLLEAIRASGQQLFASQNNPAFSVVEYDSPINAGE